MLVLSAVVLLTKSTTPCAKLAALSSIVYVEKIFKENRCILVIDIRGPNNAIFVDYIALCDLAFTCADNLEESKNLFCEI